MHNKQNLQIILKLSIIAVVCFCFAQSSYAVTKIAVMPLVNKSGDVELDWVAACPAEGFLRRAQQASDVADIQVLDATFLFPADSAAWRMTSDSLLKLHWQRWAWNAVCGGVYTFSQGRVFCDLRLLYVKNGRLQKKIIRESAVADSLDAMTGKLFDQVTQVLGCQYTSVQPVSAVSDNPAAYATYCAGYLHEMQKSSAGALSAYGRAFELDQSSGVIASRMAKLYRECGMMDTAGKWFDIAVKNSHGSIAVLTAAADFYLEHNSSAKAFRFTKDNMTLLEQSADGMVVIGKQFVLSGEIQRGIAMLTRAVAKGPSDLEADFMLGRAYLTSGEFAKAIDVFNRLVKCDPNNPRFFALLGSAYRSSGKLMESQTLLERICHQYPGNLTVQTNLAHTYFALGWYEKAYQILVPALEKNPDIPDLYIDAGIVSWFMGKQTEAGTYFTKAQLTSGNMQSAFNNQANVLFLTGDKNKAIDLYKKADKFGGRNESVLTNLAYAYLDKNRLDDAAACFDMVLSLSPSRLDVLSQCATIAEKSGRISDAMNYYRKIIEYTKHNEDALMHLAGLLKKQGMFKDALEIVEGYISDYPNSKRMLLLQAQLYADMKWYEVALQKYQGLVHDFPKDADGYLGCGRIMYTIFNEKNGTEYDQAIFYLKSAADLAKDNPEPDYLMGMIYLEYKNYRDLALDSFRAGLSKANDVAWKKKLGDCIAKAEK
jgi:tetratricopeptide (TPR) repeat protein